MIRTSPYPDVEIPDCSLTEHVLGSAAARGGALAVVDGISGEATDYAGLLEQSAIAAEAVVDLGVTRGDVVALMSRNQPSFVPAFHGIVAAGAAVTTLNPVLTVREAAEQLHDSAARLLVVDEATVEKGEDLAAEVGLPSVRIDRLFAPHGSAAGLPAPPADFDPASELAALPYSSGTTGRSKGVMLTHRNLVANLVQFAPMWPASAADVVCAVLPMFHIYGMNVIMNLALAQGSTIVTLPRFSVETYLAAIERFGVTRLHLAPPMVLQLVTSEAVDRFDHSSLRWAVSGAAPLDAELAKRFEDRFGVAVVQGYGMTEASPGTHLIADRDRDRAPAGAVGWLMPNTECRLVSPETGAEGDDEGEIWVRGPQVMAGYLNDPAATAQALTVDGWLRTGDVARCEHGLFWIVDRLKELIKVKGYQVAPAELEAVLLAHPAVGDAAVVPMPDREAGEVPKAFVVAASPVEPEELMGWVAGRVAPYKRLRAVEFIEAIPKSPSGKVLRRVLRDLTETSAR